MDNQARPSFTQGHFDAVIVAFVIVALLRLSLKNKAHKPQIQNI